MAKPKTLKTFLKTYCKELSNSEDYRIKSFIDNFDNNHRVEGPLFLYVAMYYEYKDTFLERIDKEYKETYSNTLKIVNKYKDNKSLIKHLPYEEMKALEAYDNYLNSVKADSSLKRTYLKRIKALRKNKRISDYRICKENNINHGNFHSFLSGNYEALSIDKCRAIYSYLS